MYQVMPLVVVIAMLTVVRPYSRVIWRKAWREGIQCLLCEGKRRKRILCPWIWRTDRNCSPGLGWGQAQRWRNVSEPCEDGQHVHFYWGAFKQSHVGTTKKKKKKTACNQCLKPMSFPLLCCMLFFSVKKKAIKENKADPCSHPFAFLTSSQRRFIVLKSRVYLGENRNCAFSCLYNQPD